MFHCLMHCCKVCFVLNVKIIKDCLMMLFFVALEFLCSACLSVNNSGLIKMCYSSNFNERHHPISMIVLHYTAISTCEESLARLCDATNEAGRVSAYYLVDGATM